MLWAITCYFNPQGYRNRLRNYRLFRERLGVPLVAVELSYSDSFELTNEDADILVQLHGRDLLWQKERLLNLALAELPAECDKVVWLDADGVFENPNWAEITSQLLDDYAFVQPFDSVLDLGRGQPPQRDIDHDPLDLAASLGHGLASGQSLRDLLRKQFAQFNATGCAHRYLGVGNGWATRRSVLEEVGFYDACIMGGGDMAIAAAADGDFVLMQECFQATEAHWQHYRAWAERFHAATGGAVGCTPGLHYHLWHGDIPSRRYAERHLLLRSHDYDPTKDITLDTNGVWRWNSEKPALHQAVSKYFATRCEEDPDLLEAA